MSYCYTKGAIRALMAAKSRNSALKSMELATSLSIEMIAREESRSWEVVERKYVSVSFNVEKLLSPHATETGMVRTIRSATSTFGKQSTIFASCRNCKTFRGDLASFGSRGCRCLISKHNSSPLMSHWSPSVSSFSRFVLSRRSSSGSRRVVRSCRKPQVLPCSFRYLNLSFSASKAVATNLSKNLDLKSCSADACAIRLY